MDKELTAGRTAAAIASGVAAGSAGFKAGLIIGSPLGPVGSAVCGMIGLHLANWLAVNRTLSSEHPYRQAAFDTVRAAAGAMHSSPLPDCDLDQSAPR